MREWGGGDKIYIPENGHKFPSHGVSVVFWGFLRFLRLWKPQKLYGHLPNAGSLYLINPFRRFFFPFLSSWPLLDRGWCHDLWPLLLSSRLGGRLSYLGTGIYTVRLGKSLSTSYLFVPPLIIYLLSRLSPESSVTGSVLNLEIRSYNTRSRLKE